MLMLICLLCGNSDRLQLMCKAIKFDYLHLKNSSVMSFNSNYWFRSSIRYNSSEKQYNEQLSIPGNRGSNSS